MFTYCQFFRLLLGFLPCFILLTASAQSSRVQCPTTFPPEAADVLLT